MKKMLLYSFLLLLVAYVGLTYYFSNLVLYPPRRDNAEVRALMQLRAEIDIDTFHQKMPDSEEFELKSPTDGTRLSGSYYEQDTSRCAVIIAHGYGSTRISMMKYAPVFYDCGCDVIVYDHRAHGQSEGVYGTGGALEGEDLLAVTEWTKKRTGLDADRIGWMGESWGGSTVLQAGASENDVAFIIAESSFQDWDAAVFERAERMYGSWVSWMRPGVWALVSWRTGTNARASSPLLKASAISEPVLILHSEADAETDSQQSVNIAAALTADNHRFHHLDWGARHGNNVFTRPAEYKGLLLSFIRDFVPDWAPLISCE